MKINKYKNLKNISGTRLRKLRLENNLTQQQLAEQLQLQGLEISSKEISKIENNDRLVQDFELFAFAKYFKVSVDIFCKD